MKHLSTILFSYKTTYKVATWYTRYQLMYGLHSLMPTEYQLLVESKVIRVLTNKVLELEKL
jgi:hypothetical protein